MVDLYLLSAIFLNRKHIYSFFWWFVYLIIYFYQCRLMEICFAFWVILKYILFILMLIFSDCFDSWGLCSVGAVFPHHHCVFFLLYSLSFWASVCESAISPNTIRDKSLGVRCVNLSLNSRQCLKVKHLTFGYPWSGRGHWEGSTRGSRAFDLFHHFSPSCLVFFIQWQFLCQYTYDAHTLWISAIFHFCPQENKGKTKILCS